MIISHDHQENCFLAEKQMSEEESLAVAEKLTNDEETYIKRARKILLQQIDIEQYLKQRELMFIQNTIQQCEAVLVQLQQVISQEGSSIRKT